MLDLEEIYDVGEGERSFWWSMHKTRDGAEKKALMINKILKTHGVATVELARNYNNNGRDYGVYITINHDY